MLKFETDRTCDTCHSALCTVYCRADSAYLCSACDIHIHSANSLAHRHHRVPISDNSYGGAVGSSAAEINGFLFGPDGDEDSFFTTTEDNDNAASFCDEYLDLNDYNSNTTATLFHDDDHKHYDGTSDSVVPSQYNGLSSEYNHNHLTVSFNDVSVNSVEVPTQLTAMEREARVMRYREKKKNRKFEKTIRYASRKAYAETRPRIKGRFAKRNTELEGDEVDDQVMFSSSLMAENAYGVVPTF